MNKAQDILNEDCHVLITKEANKVIKFVEKMQVQLLIAHLIFLCFFSSILTFINLQT